MSRQQEYDHDHALVAKQQPGHDQAPQSDLASNVDPARVIHFEAIAQAVIEALSQDATQKDWVGFNEAEKEALEALTAAKTGGTQHGTEGYISAPERMEFLNRAIATLQPTLSAALNPRFDEARKTYEELGKLIDETKHEIKQRLLVEVGIKTKARGDEERDKPDEDEEDRGPDGGDELAEADEEKESKPGVFARIAKRVRRSSHGPEAATEPATTSPARGKSAAKSKPAAKSKSAAKSKPAAKSKSAARDKTKGRSPKTK